MELDCRVLTDGIFQWHSPTSSSAITPLTLLTCLESRAQARRAYRQLCSGIWIHFSVNTLYFRLAAEPTVDVEEELLKTLQIDPSFKGLRFLALWSDSWHRIGLMAGRFQLLQALPELEELINISDDDGLSLEEYVIRWNKGSEIRFLNSLGYNTLPPERGTVTIWQAGIIERMSVQIRVRGTSSSRQKSHFRRCKGTAKRHGYDANQQEGKRHEQRRVYNISLVENLLHLKP